MAALEYPSQVGIASRKFTIIRKQTVSPGNGGYVQAFQRNIPLWYAEYTTPVLPVQSTVYSAALAFLEGLEGSLGTFLAYDPANMMPQAYATLPVTADPWTQTGQPNPVITATSYSNSTITLGAMNPAAIILPGDLVSCFYGNAWYLFRVTGLATDIVSNTITVYVSPRPQFTPTVSAAVRYRKACFEAKMIGGYEDSGTIDTPPAFSWKAFQFIGR